jgi:hypothetical protein
LYKTQDQIPVTAAAPANIAEAGGAKSKPLTLLLKVNNVSIQK